MNAIDLYRELATEFRLRVNPIGRGFKAEGDNFRMRAFSMSSEACCLSYWDSAVAIDVEVREDSASFMYTVMNGYLAPVRSHLCESKNPLAKMVLANINADFSKDDQFAASSRVDIECIDSAVALIRDQVKFKEIICTR